MNAVARLYLWATNLLYNQFAWAYDAVSWLVSLGRWARWRRMALDHIAGSRVLEVGFGTGELLIEMGNRGLDVFGLEQSPAMHRVTGRKLRRDRTQAPRVLAVAQRMPFADESFDSAVSTFPAGYILEPATLEEVARVIRSPGAAEGFAGGRFVVVGLLTGQRNPIARRAADILLSTTDERVLSHYQRVSTAAGLDLEMIVEGDSRWAVPVAVSRKRAARADTAE